MRITVVTLWVVLCQEDRELAVIPGGCIVEHVAVGTVVHLRADVDQAGHTHLNVLDVLEVTVVHVRARIGGTVVVDHRLADRHGRGHLRNTIEDRDGVVEAVPVQGVTIHEVWTLCQPEVGQADLDLRTFVEGQDGRRDLGVSLLSDHLCVAQSGDIAEPEHVHVVRCGGQRVWPVGRIRW